METNTLPTAEEYFAEYSKRHGFKRILLKEHQIIAAHEYAVLFAKWHVKKAIDRCVELAPYDKGVYENAYPESEIK